MHLHLYIASFTNAGTPLKETGVVDFMLIPIFSSTKVVRDVKLLYCEEVKEHKQYCQSLDKFIFIPQTR